MNFETEARVGGVPTQLCVLCVLCVLCAAPRTSGVRGAGQVGGKQLHIKNIIRETAWAPILGRRACNNGPTQGYRRRSLSWSDQCAVPADLCMRTHATAHLWMLPNGTDARGIYAAVYPTPYTAPICTTPFCAGNCFHVQGSECSTKMCGTAPSSSEYARCAASSARASPGAN